MPIRTPISLASSRSPRAAIRPDRRPAPPLAAAALAGLMAWAGFSHPPCAARSQTGPRTPGKNSSAPYNVIAAFARDPGTGSLSRIETTLLGDESVNGIKDIGLLALSPNGPQMQEG